MAIPNINKILEAQAAQRGEGHQTNEKSDDEAMEILKLIFEYMKQNNKQIHERLNAIYEQQEDLKKEMQSLRSNKDE